jgi:hypothetical protein
MTKDALTSFWPATVATLQATSVTDQRFYKAAFFIVIAAKALRIF